MKNKGVKCNDHHEQNLYVLYDVEPRALLYGYGAFFLIYIIAPMSNVFFLGKTYSCAAWELLYKVPGLFYVNAKLL